MRFIISQLRSHIARRENVLHILFGVMVAVSCWSVFSQPGLAVRNNKANIAGSVLQSLRDISQNVDWDYVNNYGGPTGKIKSPPCLTKGTRKIYHFQYPWLSQAGKPTVNQAIVVDQGTNEVKVQYNRVAGYCHYVFTPVLPLSSSKIVDPSDLRVTGTEISGISAKIVETGGSLLVPNRAGELSVGDELKRMDYSQAIAKSLRFVKDGDQPYSDQFTLAGLKDLKPGNYTVAVTLKARLVNRFGDGNNANYLCVVNETKTTQASWKTDCKESISTLTIRLTIPKEYDGKCSISGVPQTLAPGQAFTANFNVTNNGTKDWLVVKPSTAQNYFKLRPVSGNPWGKNPLMITGSGIVGTNLPAKKSTAFNATFTAPNGSVPDFTWQIVEDGGGGGLGAIATCSMPVNSKVNRPFLRVSGGDVVAGASFRNGDDFYQSAQAADAGINTNGVDKVIGGSSSEYAVFASGFINKISGLPNQFSSNDFYEPSGVKDLTFANTGVPSGGTNYGKFYGDTDEPTLPNVDITKLVEIAKAAQAENKFPNSISQLNKNLSNSVDNTGAGQKGGSAYFTGDMNTTVPQSGIPYTMQGSKVIVLDGNLEIRNNLNYGPGENNLILIVLGNINITSNVTSLEGTYIAFPKDDSTGIVDTCSNIDDDKLTVDTANCGNKLTINGRLIASKVLWKRTYGTLGPEGGVANNRCVYPQGGYDGCAAEFIKFSPAAYFNSPLNDTQSSSNDGPNNVPTNTLDLPPIY